MKTTQMLLEELKTTENIKTYLKNNKSEFYQDDPVEMLHMMLDKSERTMAEVVKESDVGDYAYKVFSQKRKASRNVLISLALTMKSDYEEVQKLLLASGYAALTPYVKRDSIILFSLFKGKTVIETDEILDKERLETISREK